MVVRPAQRVGRRLAVAHHQSWGEQRRASLGAERRQRDRVGMDRLQMSRQRFEQWRRCPGGDHDAIRADRAPLGRDDDAGGIGPCPHGRGSLAENGPPFCRCARQAKAGAIGVELIVAPGAQRPAALQARLSAQALSPEPSGVEPDGLSGRLLPSKSRGVAVDTDHPETLAHVEAARDPESSQQGRRVEQCSTPQPPGFPSGPPAMCRLVVPVRRHRRLAEDSQTRGCTVAPDPVALDEQHAYTGHRKPVRDRTAGEAATDDADVGLDVTVLPRVGRAAGARGRGQPE